MERTYLLEVDLGDYVYLEDYPAESITIDGECYILDYDDAYKERLFLPIEGDDDA